jgi:hypothetical protein
VDARLASGGDKSDRFAAWSRIDNRLGQLHPFGIIGKKPHALGQLFQQGFDHFAMPVAQ